MESTPERQIRCPSALLLSMDYLVQRVLDADRLRIERCAPAKLFDIHAFVADRTRAIRKELTLQNVVARQRNSALAMELLERIARFHILLNYELSEHDEYALHVKRMNEVTPRPLVNARCLLAGAFWCGWTDG
jgi:hypothetical protein